MSVRPSRALARAGVIVTLAGFATLATALPALAHVSVGPEQAEQGGFTTLTFHVPDESDTAGTTKLLVSLPTDHPLTSVRTTAMAGWTATVEKGPLPTPVTDDDGNTVTQAVKTVTWTAAPGTRIGPGQFLDFQLSVGPLPQDVDSLAFPTVQTYDDGKVSNWIEKSAPGAPEPEHPAPTIALVAAGAGAAGHGAPAATVTATDPTDTTARWLGGGGLLLGALGLGLGAGAVLRTRRSRTGTPAVDPSAEHERTSSP
jgi:periplasmic copper chaperone A